MNANLSINPKKNITDLGWMSHVNRLAEFETETRRYAPKQALDDVLCTVYDPLNDDFEIFEAQVKKKSDSGLLLTTNRQLENGTPILVRLKHISDEDVKDDLKDGIHAQVIQCDMIHNTDQLIRYRVAIEYF